MAKTTQEHLDYFKQRVSYWVGRFGLGCWEVDCQHQKLDERTFADVIMDGTARHCVIRFAKDLGEYEPDEVTIDSIARHEVLEIVLYDLSTAAKSFFDTDYVAGLTHQIIHCIERALDTEDA